MAKLRWSQTQNMAILEKETDEFCYKPMFFTFSEILFRIIFQRFYSELFALSSSKKQSFSLHY